MTATLQPLTTTAEAVLLAAFSVEAGEVVTEAARLWLRCDLLDWHPTHAGEFLHLESAGCFVPQLLLWSGGSALSCS